MYAIDRTLRLENNTCLSIAGEGTQAERVMVSGCTGERNQRWALKGTQLRNDLGGLCLTAVAQGKPLAMKDCSGGAAQDWQLPPSPKVPAD